MLGVGTNYLLLLFGIILTIITIRRMVTGRISSSLGKGTTVCVHDRVAFVPSTYDAATHGSRQHFHE